VTGHEPPDETGDEVNHCSDPAWAQAAYEQAMADLRRIRLGRRFAVFYAVFTLLSGWGISGVFRAGLTATGWSLVAGYVGLGCCQYAVRVLVYPRGAP
jgi:hypothetical protein